MMKKLLAVLLIVIMLFSLTACSAQKQEDNSNVLVFGTSADYAPFEFMYPDEDGNMVYGGIDVSTAQFIADFNKMELRIENMDFNYLLTALNKGDFDMVLADIEPTEKRKEACDFSKAYYHEYPEKILVRKDDAAKFVNAETDFAGVAVAGQAGSTKPQKIADNLIGAECVELALIPDMINQLVNNKVDACLLDYSVAVQYAKTNPDLVICDASAVFGDQPLEVAVAVAKGDPKGLLPKINAAIDEMEKSNMIDQFIADADELSNVWAEVSGITPEGYTPD